MLPMVPASTSQFAEVSRPLTVEPPVEPSRVERGVVVFDVDGTILDDIGLISRVAGDVLERAFGTPAAEARLHYLATTGLPFEAQLAQLYPTVPPEERRGAAAVFHTRKIQEAYATAHPFPEIPRLLRRLSAARWTLVVSTGAEREMADLVLEREGIRYWFEGLLGSGQGTKREHLVEYQRRYPDAPVFLVGDSRFDMEAASGSPGVVAIGRASSVPGWALTPADLLAWGANWADYSLATLPEVLDRLAAPPKSTAARARGRRGRDRDSPKTGAGPASL
jgi:phosphoglycolate phosphatase-like HAD superfamily hydrolase